MVRETVYVVERKDSRGNAKLVGVCKSLSGAISKIRTHLGEEVDSWVARYHETVWNNGNECIVIIQQYLEP